MIASVSSGATTKTRTQNNFPSAYLGVPDATYQVAIPIATGTVDRYTQEELQPSSGDELGQQVISYEQPVLTAVRSEVERAKRALKEVLLEQSKAIKVARAETVQMQTKTKTVRIRVGTLTYYRKAKYKKVYGPKSHRFTTWVRIPKKKRLITRYRTIKSKVVPYRYWVPLFVKRTVVKPTVTKILVRPAGLATRKIYKEVQRTYVERSDFHLAWSARRQEIHDMFADRILSCKSKLDHAKRELAKAMLTNHRALSYTTALGIYGRTADPITGLVRTTNIELPNIGYPGWDATVLGGENMLTGPRSKKKVFSQGDAVVLRPVVVTGPSGLVVVDENQHKVEDFIKRMQKPHDVSVKEDAQLVPTSQRADEVVLVEDGSSSDDAQSLSMDAAEVAALRGAEDYSFHYIRSLGELKDLPETVRQGRDFMVWLMNLNAAPRWVPKGASAGAFKAVPARWRKIGLYLAGAYLAWKFAVEPTISDAQKLLQYGLDYFAEVRKALSTLVSEAKKECTLCHVRRKYHNTTLEKPFDTVSIPNAKSYYKRPITVEIDTYLKLPSGVHVPEELYSGALTPYSSSGGGLSLTSWQPQVKGQATYQGFAAPTGESEWDILGQYFNRPRLTNPRCWVNTDGAFGDTGTIRHYVEGEEVVSFTPGSSTTFDELYPNDSLPSPVTVDTGMDTYTERVSDYLLGHPEETPKIPTLTFAKNYVTCVTYAAYHIDDIMSVLGIDETAITRIDQLAAQVTKSFALQADIFKTAWELTPLTFVYDWFTTSGTLIRTLNAHLSDAISCTPTSVDGVWQAKRVELLTGMPVLELKSKRISEWGSEWLYGAYDQLRAFSNVADRITRGEMFDSTDRNGLVRYFATPSQLHRRYICDYEIQYDTVRASRSGLYRFQRGEYVSDGLVHPFPLIKLKLNPGKLATLAAMLTTWISGSKH